LNQRSKQYVERVKDYLINDTCLSNNEKIINCLTIPAERTLKYIPKPKQKEIWKEDNKFNTLLNQRRNSNKNEHKYILKRK